MDNENDFHEVKGDNMAKCIGIMENYSFNAYIGMHVATFAKIDTSEELAQVINNLTVRWCSLKKYELMRYLLIHPSKWSVNQYKFLVDRMAFITSRMMLQYDKMHFKTPLLIAIIRNSNYSPLGLLNMTYAINNLHMYEDSLDYAEKALSFHDGKIATYYKAVSLAHL